MTKFHGFSKKLKYLSEIENREICFSAILDTQNIYLLGSIDGDLFLVN